MMINRCIQKNNFPDKKEKQDHEKLLKVLDKIIGKFL